MCNHLSINSEWTQPLGTPQRRLCSAADRRGYCASGSLRLILATDQSYAYRFSRAHEDCKLGYREEMLLQVFAGNYIESTKIKPALLDVILWKWPCTSYHVLTTQVLKLLYNAMLTQPCFFFCFSIIKHSTMLGSVWRAYHDFSFTCLAKQGTIAWNCFVSQGKNELEL